MTRKQRRLTMIGGALAVLAIAAALVAAPSAAQTIAITGGTVAFGYGSAPIPNGTVVVRDGRVDAASLVTDVVDAADVAQVFARLDGGDPEILQAVLRFPAAPEGG